MIPVFAPYLLKDVKHEDPWLPRKLLARYGPILDRAIGKQRLVAIVAAVMFIVAGAVYTFVGKTFMPTMDEGELIVGIEKPNPRC